MCISPLLLTAISTGFQVISAISQGQQQSDQAEWQSRQAAADAQASREAGEVRAEKVRKAGKATQSQARAALAGSGVEVGAGTPVKIVQDIGRNAESDAQSELLSGLNRGARLDSESAGLNIAASNARTGGYMRAGGSLLAAGSTAANKGWIGVKSYPQGNNPDEWS